MTRAFERTRPDPRDAFASMAFGAMATVWRVRESRDDRRMSPSGHLDVDDTNGIGPEHYHVTCGKLETGTWAIGVEYFYGEAPETATIQIEASGVTVRTCRGPPAEPGDVVPVASIVVTQDPQMSIPTRSADRFS